LPPFRKNSSGEYYSSDSARSTEKLGYTYPELLPGNIEKLNAILGEKYGNHLVHLKRPVDDKGKLIPGIGHETFPDYLINVEYDRYAWAKQGHKQPL
jgi:tyrosinase